MKVAHGQDVLSQHVQTDIDDFVHSHPVGCLAWVRRGCQARSGNVNMGVKSKFSGDILRKEHAPASGTLSQFKGTLKLYDGFI